MHENFSLNKIIPIFWKTYSHKHHYEKNHHIAIQPARVTDIFQPSIIEDILRPFE